MQQIAWHQPTRNRNKHRVKKVRASTGRAGMQTKLASMNISASSWSVMEWIESIIFRFGKWPWRGGTYHHYWLRILQNLVSNGCCYATSDFFIQFFIFYSQYFCIVNFYKIFRLSICVLFFVVVLFPLRVARVSVVAFSFFFIFFFLFLNVICVCSFVASSFHFQDNFSFFLTSFASIQYPH